MKRILIIGCSGAGKSTLAIPLGKKLGVPVIHLDKLWWIGCGDHISRTEFDRILAVELEKPEWIMDGDFSRTLPVRMQFCDTIVYLDYTRLTCIFGVVKRWVHNYGKTRPDMGGQCRERFDWKLVRNVWQYKHGDRETTLELLETLDGVKIIILKNRRQAKAFLKQLPGKI